jgi:hypothetical protein
MAYPVTLNGRTYTLADFEGNKYVDGLPDAFEDFVTHAGSIYKTTSTTSNTMGTGSKTFTVEALKPYQVGTPLRITDTAAPSTNWIDAIITSYSGTTLIVDAVAYAGSGTKTAWSINIGGGGTSYTGTLPIAQGGTGATTQAAARTNLGLGTGDSPEFAGVDINGGTIDGTIIGGTTPAAGSFTTFESTGIDDNATSTAMTLDSSGNLLVGKTSTGSTVAGIVLGSNDKITATRASGPSAAFVRTGSDGSIVDFQKDGSTVGSIGVRDGTSLFIESTASSRTGLDFTGGVLPRYGGSLSDNQTDLGAASYRFNDIYATNGTIQTSDRNEKQQIAALTDAEMAAAKAISAGFKTFKWNDSVKEKGDAARVHSGVIAQEVEQAVTDAGLDAGDYAFFISNTWWETQTDVPAVEAVEAVDAVHDEEGNVLAEAVEAVEAKEAYTRTDTYDTAEEAPEGATERNRKGIRYPQLLAFVGAATEQRLASFEARLDALE